ncbi:MAG: ATP-dependent DNA helicase RecG [Phycisphaerales bacterium]|nr:ATP-dependent DNA helicase RecG [Phycisphaerales bacterium]
MSETTLSLTTDVLDLPHIGQRHAEAFRAMGLRCVSDLLIHLPHRYEREEAEIPIGSLATLVGTEGSSEVQVSSRGEVAKVKRGFGRKPRLELQLEDDTGSMEVVFFNQPWLQRRIHPGQTLRVAGKVRLHGSKLQMANPRWEHDDPDAPAPAGESRLLPVYSASEHVSSMMIARAIDAILDDAVGLLDDHLSDDYRRERGLPRLDESYRQLHRPVDEDSVGSARRRLAFDELLLLQLGVMMKRHHRIQTLRAPAMELSTELQQRMAARIPFTLTESQEQVVGEIAGDLQRGVPMNRLLQGDVGAGKTVVGLQAMLMAVAAGHQATLLAPTELLAEQHAMSIERMLEGSRVRLDLLTGSMPARERTRCLEALAAGDIDIIIGTHALLSKGVEFRNLAVAIIDEQHRFGVHQRAVLRQGRAGTNDVPHQLVMTATPIPRTLSLTIFGDLDVSTIHGRLPGRTPVTTRHVNAEESGTVYTHLAERIARGEQGFVVVPVIDESESLLKDIGTHMADLQSGALSGCRLESMHGRMDRQQREAIMERFRDGEIDVLVATTVIEVGIDVPNATMIVIEQADRFGLAQLHQLRGRVGRGSKAGLCVLIADPVTADGEARLEAIVSTDDGFRIAELDMEIRGPGELVGSRQSGLPPFAVASLPRDFELLRMARRDAEAWIEADATLEAPEHALVRRRLMKRHGEALGLVDVG